MKQRIEQIIQNLSTCKDRDLFYEQLKILKHSEIEFRKGQISYKIKKLIDNKKYVTPYFLSLNE